MKSIYIVSKVNFKTKEYISDIFNNDIEELFIFLYSEIMKYTNTFNADDYNKHSTGLHAVIEGCVTLGKEYIKNGGECAIVSVQLINISTDDEDKDTKYKISFLNL